MRREEAERDLEVLADELGLSPEDGELVSGLLRLGVTEEQIREAASHGQVEEALFAGTLDPERRRRTVSLAEIEADGGMRAAEIQVLLRTLGLSAPEPEDPYFTREEAAVYRELGRLGDVWPMDAQLELSRVYGQALGRIAQTELHLFRSRVEPMVREMTASPLEALNASRQAFSWLLPLIDPILLGVHRRKLEQEMTQAAVWEVESEAEGLIPGTIEASLLFVDLRHFTSFANRHGDAKAIEMVGRLAGTVEKNLGETGRLVKALGDGYMLAFPAPAAAVSTAAALAAGMREAEGPSLHAGVHHGPTVFREGDYYGRAVNLAARLLSAAGDDELLATASVADASPEQPWQGPGERRLFGFATPIEVFSLDLRRAS